MCIGNSRLSRLLRSPAASSAASVERRRPATSDEGVGLTVRDQGRYPSGSSGTAQHRTRHVPGHGSRASAAKVPGSAECPIAGCGAGFRERSATATGCRDRLDTGTDRQPRPRLSTRSTSAATDRDSVVGSGAVAGTGGPLTGALIGETDPAGADHACIRARFPNAEEVESEGRHSRIGGAGARKRPVLVAGSV